MLTDASRIAVGVRIGAGLHRRGEAARLVSASRRLFGLSSAGRDAVRVSRTRDPLAFCRSPVRLSALGSSWQRVQVRRRRARRHVRRSVLHRVERPGEIARPRRRSRRRSRQTANRWRSGGIARGVHCPRSVRRRVAAPLAAPLRRCVVPTTWSSGALHVSRVVATRSRRPVSRGALDGARGVTAQCRRCGRGCRRARRWRCPGPCRRWNPCRHRACRRANRRAAARAAAENLRLQHRGAADSASTATGLIKYLIVHVFAPELLVCVPRNIRSSQEVLRPGRAIFFPGRAKKLYLT